MATGGIQGVVNDPDVGQGSTDIFLGQHTRVAALGRARPIRDRHPQGRWALGAAPCEQRRVETAQKAIEDKNRQLEANDRAPAAAIVVRAATSTTTSPSPTTTTATTARTI
ncbi:hypothetical protein PG991_012553 [Apiospora marii]|uniref:Uncharacterized protein n=1 Tax=Apiospora marii TaxID=335849 RepID=A0ABR1RA87_9PEZI